MVHKGKKWWHATYTPMWIISILLLRDRKKEEVIHIIEKKLKHTKAHSHSIHSFFREI